ncbi:EF-hand domain-containing protein [Stenotrophomonas sp. HITSZ_GD]|uniref:EF-hand domain-containing protein n=1 Tax=Stenotrophomonas sp. HITSZ_GD TaxID=3037248 RepID=UPI00240D921E|nr:EF-hand domain-containing protein [Stenotrophomonas sp. HITSZ_GD]MDG2523950.1 EF-hand domain-containing protein [Stenotrophomonas sp. HITSZ_GD]
MTGHGDPLARPERRLVRRSSCWVVLLALAAGSAAAQVTDSGEYLKRMDTDGDGRVSLPEYLAWMSYAFDQRDRNGDGVLTADELPGGRGKPVTRADHIATLTARFKKQDANGDGYLSAKELLAPPR